MGVLTAKKKRMTKRRHNDQYDFGWKTENFPHPLGAREIKKAVIFVWF